MAPELYQTPLLSEASDTIPVTQATQAEWRTVYSLNLPDLKAGDVMLVTANAELRNDTGVNVEVVAEVRLIAGGSQYLITPTNGHNVGPAYQDHYYATPECEAWKAPADLAAPTLVYRARCRSTAAMPGHQFTVMRGYGRLSCLLWRA